LLWKVGGTEAIERTRSNKLKYVKSAVKTEAKFMNGLVQQSHLAMSRFVTSYVILVDRY
jgi:hypothetical protein